LGLGPTSPLCVRVSSIQDSVDIMQMQFDAVNRVIPLFCLSAYLDSRMAQIDQNRGDNNILAPNQNILFIFSFKLGKSAPKLNLAMFKNNRINCVIHGL